jgi:hypothetical protein
MNITILTIYYYALGVALLARIHEISAHDHYEEIDDFQIDVLDHDVDVVSCYLLVEKRMFYHSFLHHILTSFGFRYDTINCVR